MLSRDNVDIINCLESADVDCMHFTLFQTSHFARPNPSGDLSFELPASKFEVN